IECGPGFEEVFQASKRIAADFVAAHAKRTTLEIKKAARGGKVLVDIYRNRTYQTIVCAYSVRGREGAPVSMPLSWETLEQIKDPQIYNLRTVLDEITRGGDAWEGIGAHATPLHTTRAATRSRAPGSNNKADPKTGLLAKYAEKRTFSRTPEPPPAPAIGGGRSFVIHRH